MHVDEINRKILSETTIEALCSYELELQQIFTMYISENVGKKKFLLTWKELALQNKKLTTINVIRFFKNSELIPHEISIEVFADVLIKVLVLLIDSAPREFQGDPVLRRRQNRQHV